MSTTELRRKVQEQIETADELILREILAIMKEHKKSQEYSGLTEEEMDIVMERKARYERGESKGLSLDEVLAKLKRKK